MDSYSWRERAGALELPLALQSSTPMHDSGSAAAAAEETLTHNSVSQIL